MTYGVGFNSHKYGYITSKHGRDTKAYSQWHSMIQRCYNGHVNYLDCTVCEEWLDFQEFAKWHEVTYPNDGLAVELDKDIKVPGNRVYSPETCLFVTRAENLRAAREKTYSFTSPSGGVETFTNLTAFCKVNDLTHSSMSRVHSGKRKVHKGWTLAEQNIHKLSSKTET
jgi:hypothetical protein